MSVRHFEGSEKIVSIVTVGSFFSGRIVDIRLPNTVFTVDGCSAVGL
jgi:hypothetical protein